MTPLPATIQALPAPVAATDVIGDGARSRDQVRPRSTL